MNIVKTGMLLAAMTALFMALGLTLGGTGGMLIALVVAVGMNAFTYWNADKIVLKMHDAREVDDRSAPEFVGLVRELARNAGLPMPRTYIVDTPHPNAFATGRDPDHAAVAATAGLLEMLSRDEIAGVMAHELGHVRNRDTLTMTMVATIAGATAMLANFGLFFRGGRGSGLAGLLAVLVAPFAAMIVQMAISRTREYAADRAGAEISGKPLALASALERLERGARAVRNPVAERAPATAQLYIVNALAGDGDRWFATHPSTTNRIAALRRMAGAPAIGATVSGSPRVVPEARSGAASVPITRKRVRSALDPLGPR